MTRPACRTWTARVALWAAVWALLLKAAVPMLATASAEWQGKTLVEVCTVYGVTTVALDAADGSPAPADHPGAHAGEHCVLSALLALSTTEALVSTWPSVQFAQAPPALPTAGDSRHDAQARWAAGLKHGPPRRG